ncbi:hypothetical protein SBA2_150003 [Acidobacteriia bacterium SbA2]|nr:hypothetical protein SBA2_150003 [Acidobacteriia bacterium SbA2]
MQGENRKGYSDRHTVFTNGLASVGAPDCAPSSPTGRSICFLPSVNFRRDQTLRARAMTAHNDDVTIDNRGVK